MSVVQQAFRAARSKPPRINNVFVPPTHVLYPRMVERYDRGEGGKVGELRGVEGLWVPMEWIPQRKGHSLVQAAAASRSARARAEAAE